VIVSELAPGSVLADTYRISRVLAEGGMGRVLAAQDIRTSRGVAIKVMRERPTAQALARFRQEAKVASRLRHDNIVEVLDFKVLPNGTAFLVMELLEGESLDARLKRGALPVDQITRITRQIAAGLAAAHSAGVIHRDLKPENIFLVDNHVKILDFGISKLSDGDVSTEQPTTVLGTPHYMSPEQATVGNDDLDARADQFSLAVITYEMLAGRPPFEGNGATAVMYRIVHAEPPSLATLAPAAAPRMLAAIQRAMAKAPADRFPDIATFADAFTGT